VLQLPADLQQKVRLYVSSKRRQSDGSGGNNSVSKPEPKMIKVPIPTFPPTAMVYSINKVPAGECSNSALSMSLKSSPAHCSHSSTHF
jgi:hypothetical protein